MQNLRFYRAKQQLSQRQIEITVFLTNYLCKVKAVFTCWLKDLWEREFDIRKLFKKL